MYQFFVESYQVGPEYISILGDDVNHIKNVLRMKPGTRVRVSVRKDALAEGFLALKESEKNFSDKNPKKNMLRNKDSLQCVQKEELETRSFFGIIEQISEEEVLVKIESQDKTGTELSNRIYLFQGLPKGDKMELIIQKAVELGVYQIIPVAMKNCVVKLDDKKAAGKVKRWQAISESAAKQSKRTIIPEIKMPLSWKLALKEAENLDIVLVPYENERGMEATREIMQSIKPEQSIGIFVGPEGGFSPEEIDSIAPMSILDGTNIENVENETCKINTQDMNNKLDKTDAVTEAVSAGKSTYYHRISLGRRILRTETAGLATLSMLVFCLDE